MKGARGKPRRSLFRKYFLVLFIVVSVPLLTTGLSDAWFGYRDQRALLNSLLRSEANSAAARIETFLDTIKNQLSWTVRLNWSADTRDQHRFDALGVLRQVPAVISITLVDGDRVEQLFLSRIDLNRIASGIDRSRDPAVSGARSTQLWYGPVIYYQGSEPHMTIGLSGNRKAAGIVVAEINLKLIWDVISAIEVGENGQAFILDETNKLFAHPDISRVLRGTDDATLIAMRDLRRAIDEAEGEAIVAKNISNGNVVIAMSAVSGTGWAVFVEQPLSEAFAPIYSALWRTAGLMLAAAAFSALLAFWLARRMARPIGELEKGADHIGAGDFDYRIEIATGDELELLANRFNLMARGLAVSQERSERISRLKRFLAPQVAELVEKSGDESVLAGQRAEVVVVFCDLRGFTAFSAGSEPDEIMQVLSDYHEALGSIITRYEATLTNFSGDGLMILVNAPVRCAEPAIRAVDMAIEMQTEIQKLVTQWRSRGYELGFGVGLAIGEATVGRIGYEGRVEYTAIGNVVNLASRLCSSADNDQILIDPVLAETARGNFSLVSLGRRRFKGYEKQLAVFSVSHS